MAQGLFDAPVMLESQLEGLPLKSRGKVRDIYDLDEHLLLVATDRISAFDVVLPEGIPGKGAVLTQLSVFWFRWLYEHEDIVPNHFITSDVADYPRVCRPYHDILKGRSMLVQKAAPLPIECIVRGYLSGSGWADYQRTGEVCGQSLPHGSGRSMGIRQDVRDRVSTNSLSVTISSRASGPKLPRRLTSPQRSLRRPAAGTRRPTEC